MNSRSESNKISLRRINYNNEKRIGIFFKYDINLIDRIKSIPKRKYSNTLKCWHLPDNDESIEHILDLNLNVPIGNIENFDNVNKLKFGDSTIDTKWLKKLEEYEEYLEQQRYSPSTIKSYILVLKLFLSWFTNRKLTQINIDVLRKFNHDYFIKGSHSRSYQNIWINALKLFLAKHTDIEVDMSNIERPRKSEYLPNILSQEEIKALVNSYDNLKHKAIIMCFYACGLRKSELINLKLIDIDGQRKVIRIRNSKGAKDRDVALPNALLKLLREYFTVFKPEIYLFNGLHKSKYSATSINKVLKKGLIKSKITKRITPHSLRHSYATHLVEQNINLRFIQEALGHKSSKTTEIYTKLSKDQVSKMTSPIDFWEDVNDTPQQPRGVDNIPKKEL